MSTVLDRETQKAPPSSGRYCDGCPRCTGDPSLFCTQRHEKFGNLHPVCKRCGHCVLRGSHDDDISDLSDP